MRVSVTNAALPALELVGAAADRLQVEGVLADRIDDLLRHDRELDELGQQRRIGAFVVSVTYWSGRPPPSTILSNWPSCGLPNFGSVMRWTLKTTSSAVSFEPSWKTIRRANLELDLGVGQIFPGGRDLRNDLALVVAGDKIVEDVAVDVIAVRIPLHLRIERGRLVHEVDDEPVFRSHRRQSRRGEEREGDGYNA